MAFRLFLLVFCFFVSLPAFSETLAVSSVSVENEKNQRPSLIDLSTQMGGAIGGVGLGVLIRPLSFLGIKGQVGSAIFFNAWSIESRFYLSNEAWSPYLSAGMSRWMFDDQSKGGRFLMNHYDLISSEQMVEDKPETTVFNALFGVEHSFTPYLAWFFEGGLLLKNNGGLKQLVSLPTVAFGLSLHVF